MLQEAASGGQMSKLQKELEQLRTDAGQMKVHLQAATQSQMDAQVPRSCLTVVSMPAMRLTMLRSFLPCDLCCFAMVYRQSFHSLHPSLLPLFFCVPSLFAFLQSILVSVVGSCSCH